MQGNGRCGAEGMKLWSGVSLRWRYLGGYVARERRARLGTMPETLNASESPACTTAACDLEYNRSAQERLLFEW